MKSQERKIKLQNIGIVILMSIVFGVTYNYLYYPHNLAEYAEAISISILIGICIGFTEESLLKSIFQRLAFYQVLLIRTVLYSVAISVILSLVLSIEIAIENEISYFNAWALYLKSPLFIRDFSFSLTFAFAIILLSQVLQLIGMKNLARLIFGQFHSPREVDRVFMFIDLNESTRLAEELDNRSYSAFIKEYFNDVSNAISKYGGEVYQYVGDEISVLWSVRENNDHCIKCFFQAKKNIDDKRDHYLAAYGNVPQFKGGAHVGSVVVTEVGKLKKELVYHGDVVNTTSRIIGKCNELKQELLVSEDLLSSVENQNFTAAEQGEIPLKGKSHKIRISGMKEIERSSQSS